MAWRGLLQDKETQVLPWVGGRSLRSGPRRWSIEGGYPPEHGWSMFTLNGRKAYYVKPAEPEPERLRGKTTGYLVGNRLVSVDARVDPDPKNIVDHSEQVRLIEPGLDRFVLVSAGRICEDGPLIYIQQEMPLGPEFEVQTAFLDDQESVAEIKGVCPALDAAFRMEIWQRKEAERRRQELKERRKQEEEARQREAKRLEIIKNLGDGATRREVAKESFEDAARAALAVGGAEFLDCRPGLQDEKIVKFRLNRERYECVCDKNLRIIDAGVCLTDHDTGEKGDTLLTLESLPSVILEALALGELVVFRHV